MDRLSEYVIKHSSCTMPRCEYVENDIEIDCDRCQEIMIREHDKQIRADEKTKVLDGILIQLTEAFNDNDDINVMYLKSYLQMTKEQLKEQNMDNEFFNFDEVVEIEKKKSYNQALDDCRKKCGADTPHYTNCIGCPLAHFENDFNTTICKLEQLKK